MRLRRLAYTALALAAWGCGPPEVVPVGPPGIEYRELVPEEIPEDQAAEALGEMRTSLQAEASADAPATIPPAEPTEVGKSNTLPSGLTYETLKPGSGPMVKPGQRVTLHYTGTLENGTVFDSSREKGEPYTFSLGYGQVIPGWDQGVTGMKVGERRKLMVPAKLGYGERSPGAAIPPNSNLIFDVELLRAE